MASKELKNNDPNLKDFVRIGPQSYILTPNKGVGSDSTASTNHGDTKVSSSPDLTILCTWLGAPSRPIAKYISGYLSLYPQTPILLLRSVFDDFTFRTPSSQVKRTKAAAELVKDYVDEAKSEARVPKFLFHVFSNGGSWSACMLNQAYEEVTRDVLPVSAIVIDSAPSLPRARLGHNAMMQAVPKFILVRLFAAFLFWVVIGLYYVLDKLRLHQSVVIKLRQVLNDTSGPYLRKGIARTYVCSKQDEMVPLQDVILHASEARVALEKIGVQEQQQQISIEEFNGSRHVGHMMVDTARYWDVVGQTWLKIQ